jgi:ligand-binding SRPBCC domain-containing protein
MNANILERSQLITGKIEDVWDYFSSPENLNELTPKNMGFKILSKTPIPKMHEGQIIEYKVSPILGIPLYWKTIIKEVVPLQSFVDEQAKGPYKLWRHTHTYTQQGDQVLMTDKVEYLLPLGYLGQMLNPIFVRARLEEIFDYRYERVEQLFNKLVLV